MQVKAVSYITALAAFALVVSATAQTQMTQTQSTVDLKPGDQAPAWSLPGSDGKTYTLGQFKGKQAVVLAWFPKAFTGG